MDLIVTFTSFFQLLVFPSVVLNDFNGHGAEIFNFTLYFIPPLNRPHTSWSFRHDQISTCDVIKFERYAIISGTFQIIWFRSPCCLISPLTLRQIRPWSKCPVPLVGTSSLIGPDFSKDFSTSQGLPSFLAYPNRSIRVMSNPSTCP